MRYLGIDWGEKRIGLALGDSETLLATPFKIASSINEILLVIKDEGVEELVIGEPIKMSGDNKNFLENYKKFVKDLEEFSGLKINFIDERLTSKAADALSGTKKTKASRDSIAAMLILQSYLDRSVRNNFI